ncbi:6-phosphogluconolactonase [Mucilaginibacter sp. HMF5004]|uniref:6-phosphogluconolactonase n=1 Tax=Mucilaginibacter rivuli TaxID=2857527 RepID=UPI001C5F0F07|nr:6-phosphogluconolactonase [Mucilaginibacter rivuli]MBW4889173.1 6-phosphogluconolactonase [Mucilaginibacter rivuli]
MLHIFNTTDEVLHGLAAFFIQAANKAIAANGQFVVSLSGGSSPKSLYELLASETYKDQVDWKKVYFFFGDERNVPDTDKDSNALMAQKALFEPLKIASGQVFKVDTSLPPAEAADDYTDTINHFFNNDVVKFDLVLLGLGDNSHTASLFPHTPILNDKSASVKPVWLEDQQVYRISFTAPLINQATHIAFLVYGAGKAEAVHHILKDPVNIPEYPAQLIRKDVDWFLDEPAAFMLNIG